MPYSPQTRLIWPITQQGKVIAQQFANDHHHPAIAERVRQNTLAVWVIHEFLDALGIATDLSHSDSWNPAMQLTEDVADLVVSGVGRLECRPVPVDTRDCLVPSEALTERIGYIAVVLDEAVGEASLLGFVPDVPSTRPQLSLAQLQPMDDFPAHLHHVRQGERVVASQLTRLSQWLDGHFETGWQAAEDLLAQYFLTPAFRQGATVQQDPTVQIKRAKQLELGPGAQTIALVLDVEQDSDSSVMIGVRLYPLGGAASLPAGLTVTILDETDTVCLTAQARSVDNYLQLYFRGRAGEPFTTQIVLGDVQLEERFII